MGLILFKLLAGIVIFLLGFSFIEEAIRNVTGRAFKLFLKKHTSQPVRGLVAGALVTAILQSSSIVNFLVLSFVGTGVLNLYQALAVMLGANIGTTVTSWIIVLVGFKLNLEGLAFPLIALCGFFTFLYKKQNILFFWMRLLFGMGFLFFGLEYIKISVFEVIASFDLAFLNQSPLLLFVLFGLIATTLTQSSSATVVLALSALNAEAISLISAMAIVLGSEVGTTLKLVLAALDGPVIKKKVALGNLVFNSVTLVVAFALIRPTHSLIRDFIGIGDHLVALVFYQSLINVGCAILFLPILKKLGHWLEVLSFKDSDDTSIIRKVKVTDGDYAYEALETETHQMMQWVLVFTRKAFRLENPAEPLPGISSKMAGMDRLQWYNHLKSLHGEIRNYAFNLQRLTTEEEKLNRIDQLLETVRDAMFAVKSIKDSFHDIDLLSNSSNDVKFGFYMETRQKVMELVDEIGGILQHPEAQPVYDQLFSNVKKLEDHYHTMVGRFYKDGFDIALSGDEFSTLINFNREVFNAGKYLIIMLKEYYLSAQQAELFDEQLHAGL